MASNYMLTLFYEFFWKKNMLAAKRIRFFLFSTRRLIILSSLLLLIIHLAEDIWHVYPMRKITRQILQKCSTRIQSFEEKNSIQYLRPGQLYEIFLKICMTAKFKKMIFTAYFDKFINLSVNMIFFIFSNSKNGTNFKDPVSSFKTFFLSFYWLIFMLIWPFFQEIQMNEKNMLYKK